MTKEKIQIKSINGDVLFEYEKENNTIKDTVEEAVRQNVSLNGAQLDFAQLDGAQLDGAQLDGAKLNWAILNGAKLNYASLIGAKLNWAILNGATLNWTKLNGATLDWAILNGASLKGANLNGASLIKATLDGVSLFSATLSGAKNIPNIPLACPSDGAFIGWKKVARQLIQLEIPEDAKRCSATSNKCRCDKAMVVSITDIETGVKRNHITNYINNKETTYTVGEMVYPDSFDEDRWNECSHGIHFFINKQEAIDY